MSYWPEVTLGDVFTIARGGSPRPIDDFITSDPSGANWIMIGDAVEGSKYITATKKRIRREGVSRSREVKPGDFLLTNSMSFGRPYILQTSGCIHDGWLVLSPRDSNVDQDFFYYLLGSPHIYAEFTRLAAGAVVKNLNSELVRGVKVRLPPVQDQRRIANILDKANAIRRRRKEALALSEELLRSAFLDMFGDPAANPKRWTVKQLGEIADVATGGTPSRANADYYGGGVPWVKTGEVDWCEIEGTEEHITERAVQETNCKIFPPETLLIAMYGQGATRGKCALLRVPAATNQACAAILPSPVWNRDFLFQQIRLSYERLRGLARGGNQENLNLALVKSLPIIVPPACKQAEYAEAARAIGRVREQQNRGLLDADNLLGSLAADAFCGQL